MITSVFGKITISKKSGQVTANISKKESKKINFEKGEIVLISKLLNHKEVLAEEKINDDIETVEKPLPVESINPTIPPSIENDSVMITLK